MSGKQEFVQIEELWLIPKSSISDLTDGDGTQDFPQRGEVRKVVCSLDCEILTVIKLVRSVL